MSTQLEGKIIEYHMSSDEFTDEYKEALKTSIMVENFFDSPVPQKVTKKASKRKSTTYYDSEDVEPSFPSWKLTNIRNLLLYVRKYIDPFCVLSVKSTQYKKLAPNA